MKEKFDDLMIENNLKSKVYKEMEEAKNKKNIPQKNFSFENLDEKQLFSQKALWKVFNRKNVTNSILNGIQAEAYLSEQHSTRADIIAHKIDCFLANHLFIEFYKFCE